jgi:hypothetical protein
MNTENIKIADNFVDMIKTLSDDVKLDIIAKIKASLTKTRRKQADDTWKDLFGAFKSDQTAEEMIHEIRSSRHTNRQIEDLK